MSRRTKPTITAGAAVAALALVQFAQGPARAQRPAASEKTIRQLMAEEVQPVALTYWEAVQYVVDETGDHEIVPETEEAWARTEDAAIQLAELGELLKAPRYAEGRDKEWVELSGALVKVAGRAKQAAEDRDVEQVFEVGATIYGVCSACHVAYGPPRPDNEAAEE